MSRYVFARLAAVAALAGLALAAPAAAQAVGGPVILGGDDLTDHGCLAENGDTREGWLYIQRALENISPRVTFAGHDGKVHAIGSEASDDGSGGCSDIGGTGDAGAAIGFAADKAGLEVVYHEGVDAIDDFFSALEDGTVKPKIIWISGDGAGNDLDSDEKDALADEGARIADYVNAGGGLMSHGDEDVYTWLFALLPDLEAADCLDGFPCDEDLYATPEGQAAFPGVTNDDFNAGPWHNFFQGGFGGLQVLVRSDEVDDKDGNDAAVVIGGASVTLPGSISLDPPTAVNAPGTSHTVVATVRRTDGTPAVEVMVTFEVTAGPNTGQTATAETNQAGQATWTYTSNGVEGTDTIRASFLDSREQTRSATATKVWRSAQQAAAEPPPADIGVVKSDSPDPVDVGALLTYRNVVTNHGPGSAPGSTFGDTLPGQVTLVSVSTTKGSCSGTTRIECSFGTLAVGEQVVVTIVVRVSSPGTFSNTAEVGTTAADWNVGANQRSTVSTTAQGPFQPPQAGCTLTASVRTVTAGIRSTILVRAESGSGAPLGDVPVTLTGTAGIATQRDETDSQGRVSFVVRPSRSGRITVRGQNCGAAVPVDSVRSSSCSGVRMTPAGATVGEPTVVRVSVRVRGQAVAGARVTVRGAGVAASGRTNAQGVAVVRVQPVSPGLLTVRVPQVLTCSRQFGVAGAFAPPRVTG